ncbi:transcriptional regulator [Psychrobacillus sp. FSL K6-1464]|uniref:transcriptional regulator n=1 Tax=Psychrobacillus sp. FSL K6-1464 TaxID=2921545 RepID=UPI0030FA3C4B
MRINLMKCMERNQLVELMYMDSKGNISQRRVKVLRIQGDTFQVFCFMRNAKRTFIMNNVLACVPVIHKEREVV